MSLKCRCTCEPAGLSQQERAPGHQEKQSCLQQREVPQLGELGHVIKIKGQGAKQKLAHPQHLQPPAAPTSDKTTDVSM